MGNGPLVCCMTQEERIFQIITEDDNNYKTIKRARIHNPIEISFDLEQCILVQKYIRRFIAKLRFNQSARDLQRIIKQKLLGYKVKQSNSFINSHKAEQLRQALNRGEYVIAYVRGGGHWVFVDRVEGDNVYIIDPGANITNLFDYSGVDGYASYKIS